MFHFPQSNDDDQSLICSTHPVRKFFGFHLRRFLIPLLLLASCGLLQTLLADEIIGKLGNFRNNDGDEYFGIDVEKLLIMETPDGKVLVSVYPQLVGLSQESYDQALQWKGRRVRVSGKPMEKHTVHHASPVLWVADKITIEEEIEQPKPEGSVLERINLFGVPTDLVIQQNIPDTESTWSQVREITLKYLDAQPQDKPSPPEALKRLDAMHAEFAKKYNKGVKALADKTNISIEEAAFIFQLGKGSEIAPEIKDIRSLVSGYKSNNSIWLKLPSAEFLISFFISSS
jgi:hypothetical protein